MSLAPLWKRVVAFVIDIAFLVALYSTLIGLVHQVLRLPTKNSPILERGLSLVITPYVEEHFLEIVVAYSLTKLAVIFPYFALMESSRRQATLGKMAVGIQVVDTAGKRISLARACGRSGAKLLSGILLVGYAIAVFTEKRQALHDLLAGTLVIDARASGGQVGGAIRSDVTPATSQSLGGETRAYLGDN